MSTKFLAWLKDKGIEHQHSMPYEPEQNGAAERLHRTVGEIAQTALIASGLPVKFWGYAYLWGYFTHNRIVNLLTGNKTPIELMFSKKPLFDKLRSFGEVAFVHKPETYRSGKIDERAWRCNLVGYVQGGKGWIFWVATNNTFFESSIAVFPYSTTPSTTPPKSIRSKLTLSSSLNNEPDPKDVPLHNFDEAIEQDDDTPIRRPIDKILNAEDVSPTIFNTSMVLGSNHAESVIDSQSPKAMGLNIATRTQLMPRNYTRAVNRKDGDKWLDAVHVELNNLWDMGVWHFETVPPGRKQTDAQWLFDIKRNQDGSIKKYKARYIVQGFSQIFGQDYHDTWAPTATFALLRMLFTVAASNQWAVETFDIAAAYLHGAIDEDVWVKVPDGMFVPEEHRGKSLKLDKGLYGTKQGGHCWWKHFVQVMEGIGFHVSLYDDSFYHIQRGGETILVWIHVDDGVVTASSASVLREFRAELESRLKTTWDGNLHNIIGIKVERPTLSKFILSQPFLTQKIVDTFTTDSTLPRKVPIKDTNSLTTLRDKEEVINPNGYLSVVGSLNYLVVATRPDLAFVVGFLA
jgi:hypothetical protein